MDYDARPNQSAEIVSLRAVVDDINQTIRDGHVVLNALEDKISGPSPRPLEKGEPSAQAPTPHPGVRVAVEQAAKGAADLVSRLHRLTDTI